METREQFIQYCLEFYGENGMYRDQQENGQPFTHDEMIWGVGILEQVFGFYGDWDTVDREWVRDRINERRRAQQERKPKGKPYTLYADPSHGWVAVKRQELVDLGILEKVSEYSYQKGGTVYLEEDADLTLWVEAFKNRFGHEPNIVEKHVNESHRIRSYQSFQAVK